MTTYLNAKKPILYWFLILLFSYAAIFNYEYLFLIGVFFFGISISKESFTDLQISLLIKFPYVFYSIRLIAGINENLNALWKSMSHHNYSLGARFFDLQQVLVSVKCNFSDTQEFYYNYSPFKHSCPWSANYGPLLEVIPYFGSIWRDTIILSVIFLFCLGVLYRYLLNQFPKNQIFIMLLFISPSMNFLIERMNIDVMILLLSFFAIKNILDYPLLSSFTLFLLALLKLHPLGFIFGIILYSYIYEKKNLLKINISLTGLFLIIYSLFSYIKQTALTTTWRPSEPLLTFGILSDAKFLNESLNLTLWFVYLLLIFFLLILQNKIFNTSFLISNKIPEKSIVFIYSYGIFLLLNILYANYDYRIPIIFPLVIYIIPFFSDKIKILVIATFLLMPFGITNSLEIFELAMVITGKILFYYFFSVVIRFIFYDVKSKNITN